MSIKTVAILAAGVGSRLRPITDSVPKCLVRVCGKPILGHQLDAFRRAGVTQVKIVAGYKAESIIEYVRGFDLDVEVIVNQEYERNNNMYSMYMLRAALKGEEFIFCNGDVVYDYPIIEKTVHSDGSDLIVVDRGTYDAESMKVVLAPDGHISGIRKTFTADEAYGRSIDLYRLAADGSNVFFEEIESVIEGRGDIRQWTEVAIDSLAADGRLRFAPLDIHPHRWVEIDNYEDLAVADRVFAEFDAGTYKAFFFDIDGTLGIGDRPIEGAADFVRQLREAGKDVYFVTNNSSRSKSAYVAKLARLEIHASTDEIILSTDGLTDYLKSASISKVFCIGTNSMCEELRSSGIDNVENGEAQVVVVGYDTELTYAKLAHACTLINGGTDYYVTHRDICCPSPNGPLPDAGTFIKMIEMTTGVSPRMIFGKPHAEMLTHIVGVDYAPEDTAFVGDRTYTDKKMADAVGMDFVCVLSGETKREDLQAFDQNEWPRLVIPSLGHIE